MPVSECNTENDKMTCPVFITSLPSVVFFIYVKKLQFVVLPCKTYKLFSDLKYLFSVFLFCFLFCFFLRTGLSLLFCFASIEICKSS